MGTGVEEGKPDVCEWGPYLYLVTESKIMKGKVSGHSAG